MTPTSLNRRCTVGWLAWCAAEFSRVAEAAFVQRIEGLWFREPAERLGCGVVQPRGWRSAGCQFVVMPVLAGALAAGWREGAIDWPRTIGLAAAAGILANWLFFVALWL